MIFRAVFWIGLVALLIPREPDLGLGRPGAGHGSTHRTSSCEGTQGCAGGLSLLYAFQDKAKQAMASVKADLDANRKVRLTSPL